MGFRRSSHCDSVACVEVSVPEFTKSSHSLDNGTCVEVGFRKSSRSAGNGNCVEVAVADEVLVRDSKDPDGPRLSFAPDAFAEFLAGVKLGQFDRR